MCSAKWEIPLTSGASWREPERIHTPADTERMWGISSLMIVSPLGRTVLRTLRSAAFKDVSEFIRTLSGRRLDCA
jgi:hypothetical protein